MMRKNELIKKLYEKTNIYTRIIITDQDKIDKFNEMLDNDQELPKGIINEIGQTMFDSVEYISGNVFYEIVDDKIIEEQKILRDLLYKKRISIALTYFMVLSLIIIFVMLILVISILQNKY